MPVSVKRILWLASAMRGSGHMPYKSLFDDCRPLMMKEPHEEVRATDAIFFDGGTDIQSTIYGEKPHAATDEPDLLRDKAEIGAFDVGRRAGALLIGTCRGAQLLCALSGGKLIQHVTGHYGNHTLRLENGELLQTESSHHQMMWPNSAQHILIGWADPIGHETEIYDDYQKPIDPKKLAEIVYFPVTRAMCVQGHAEWTPDNSMLRELVKKLATRFMSM